jgi:hypothetical protein
MCLKKWFYTAFFKWQNFFKFFGYFGWKGLKKSVNSAIHLNRHQQRRLAAGGGGKLNGRCAHTVVFILGCPFLGDGST